MRPHERTLAAPKADRLKLLRAARANLSVVFLLYEGIVRREPSVKVRIAVQQVGLVLLLAFMVFVIFNDAVRWFG